MKADKFQLAYMKMLSRTRSTIAEDTQDGQDPLAEFNDIRETEGYKALIGGGFKESFDSSICHGPVLTYSMDEDFYIRITCDMQQDGSYRIVNELRSAKKPEFIKLLGEGYNGLEELLEIFHNSYVEANETEWYTRELRELMTEQGYSDNEIEAELKVFSVLGPIYEKIS